MVGVTKSVIFIVFAALIVTICTANAVANSEELDSVSSEELYSVRDLMDMLMDKRIIHSFSGQQYSLIYP